MVLRKRETGMGIGNVDLKEKVIIPSYLIRVQAEFRLIYF